jgi:Ca2+-binding RTX toxin-like protein
VSDADTLIGGLGYDKYIIDDAFDVVVENKNGGYDDIESSVSYTLSANVEGLTLTGSDALTGTGNELGNVIVGNSGNNVIDGMAGEDELQGGDGNDTLRGGGTAAEQGSDKLFGGFGDDLLIGGTAASNYLVGEEGNDKLVGGDHGSNWMWGGTGQDTLSGGLEQNSKNILWGEDGDDVLTGGLGQNDLIGGTGNDTLSAIDGATSTNMWGEDGDDRLVGGQGENASNYLSGGAGQDILIGGDGALLNLLSGEAGDDVLQAGTGDNNTLEGGSGHDTVFGNTGNDMLGGGTGNDVLTGHAGADLIYGDEGDDLIYGDGPVYSGSSGEPALVSEADTISGGRGNDTIMGGVGNNVYSFDLGDGQDLILGLSGSDLDANAYAYNTLYFGTGISPDGVSLRWLGDDRIVVSINGTTDSVTIGNFFTADSTGPDGTSTVWTLNEHRSGVGFIHFNDGTEWNMPAILARLGSGSAASDALVGTDGADSLSGLAGDDLISAGAGHDTLAGGSGNDTMIGGAGNDLLQGGTGHDTYVFGLGDGNDTIASTQATPDEIRTNVLYFKADVLPSQVRGYHVGADLVLSVIGTSDSVTIQGFYTDQDPANASNPIQQVAFIGQPDLTWDLATLAALPLLNGTSGDDTLTGTAGDDVLDGLAGNDLLEGLEGDDVLAGSAGRDTLQGGNGNDFLDGGTGADALVGGAGNDTYIVDDSADTVTELASEGSDTLRSTAQSYAVTGDVEFIELVGTGDQSVTGSDAANTITGNAGHNLIDGGAGNDTLIGGDGNDSLLGHTGADSMLGGAGDDFYRVGQDGDEVIESANAGTDTVEAHVNFTLGANVEHLVMGGIGNLTATGNALDNRLTGNDGFNLLVGDAGNDTLDGGLGGDILVGGTGNDLYFVNSAADVVTELAGQGTDTLRSTAQNFLATGEIEFIELVGTGAQSVTGSDSANTITGNAGNNQIDGGAGDDTLIGGDGNDSLLGNTGNDSLVGGLGDDFYRVGQAGDVVVEQAGEGSDTVEAHISVTLGAHVEHLTLGGEGHLEGTGNSLDNRLTGNDGFNLLDGGAGNDTLDGGLGGDTLVGGTGNDLYFVNSSADLVIEQAGQGSDSVVSTVSYTLRSHFENLTLGSGSGVNAIGNDLANTLTGNANDNLIDGGAGNDSLVGAAGNDSLLGDIGVDTMVGGLGDDFYRVGETGDVVTEQANEGTDTVEAYANFTLGANVEHLTLGGSGSLQGAGNSLDNRLTGNDGFNLLDGGAGNDTLDGGIGADTLVGGLGNDVYHVNSVADVITEVAGEGTDTVYSTALNFVTTSDIEFIELVGSGNQSVTASGSANTITGNDGHNLMDGGAGNDVLNGGDGDDTLIGGLGVDTLTGGQGDDVYRISDSSDLVIEAAGEGTDIVEAHANFTLGANVEHLTLGGGSSLQGAGNSLDNRLTGNDGFNLLDGGAGNDTLDGGLGGDTLLGGTGNDLYFVNSAADVVTELAGQGTDTVQSTAQNFVATGAIEFIHLVGTGDQSVTGSDSANTITGNAGHNQIDGGAGDDTLIGGDGNDSLLGNTGDDSLVGGLGDDFYRVGEDGDVVIEQTGEGTDTVEAHANFTLGANVEHLTLGGGGSLQGAGNSLDNRLTGNDGFNLLDGGAGNDTLDGGLGGDTLVGGTGNDLYLVNSAADVVTEVTGEGTDTIRSTALNFVATGDIEFIELVGAGNQSVTGSDAANTITGNAGHNQIDGGAGDDTLIGGDGNDSLLGNTGNDSLVGGLGDDLYRVGEAGDVVEELAGEGTDTVDTHISYTLGANVEHLTMGGGANLQGAGNSLDNRLTGNDGFNLLDGGAGNDTLDGGIGGDTLVGGTGNDLYFVNSAADVVTELAGQGTDTVQSTAQNFVATGAIEFINLVGTGDQSVTGSESANTITGNAGNNQIDGGAGDDTLIGGDGNDSLLGNTGNDSLVGGLGDDFYRVGSAGDVVVELAGQGTDTVESNLYSYTLGSTLENLVLGNGAYAGYGNALANTITGNSTANFMAGGAGDDTYVFQRGGKADVVRDTDSTPGNTDLVSFGAGIAADQLWFRHVGNDLQVSVIGTSDSVTVRNWYLGSQNRIEQFSTSDGKLLLDSAVDNLVNAMASFSPPAAGQTTLTASYQASLSMVIASNWQ